MRERVQILVTKDYEAQYPAAIILRPGDCVECGKSDPEFPGWVWCRSAEGKSAWVPERIIERAEHSPDGRILEGYDSTELTVKAGEKLIFLEAESGWVWAEDSAGRRGWVPESCLGR